MCQLSNTVLKYQKMVYKTLSLFLQICKQKAVTKCYFLFHKSYGQYPVLKAHTVEHTFGNSMENLLQSGTHSAWWICSNTPVLIRHIWYINGKTVQKVPVLPAMNQNPAAVEKVETESYTWVKSKNNSCKIHCKIWYAAVNWQKNINSRWGPAKSIIVFF